jgi:hypothetical protein
MPPMVSPVAPEAPPPGPAWDHPATREGLDRYRRRSWLWVVEAVAVVLLGAGTAASIMHRSANLQRTGVRTLGTVTGLSGLRSDHHRRDSGGHRPHDPPVCQTGCERPPGLALADHRFRNPTRPRVSEYHPEITLAAIESDDITLYAAPWRMKYLHRSPSKTLWVAEDPTGKNLVLTPDGGVNLFRASRPGP